MTQRNVDLIIRARDDATKAFNSVNEALESLAGIQKRVSAGADDLSGSLRTTQKDAKALSSSIAADVAGAAGKAQSGFDRVADAVRRASAEFRRNEAQVKETAARLDALRAQAAAAAAALERMRSTPAGNRTDAEKQRIDSVKAALTQLRGEIRTTETSLGRQTAALQKSAANFEKVQGASSAASIALREFEERQRRVNALVAGTAARDRVQQTLQRAAPASEGAAAGQERVARAFRQAEIAARALNPTLGRTLRELLLVGPAGTQAGLGLERGARGANGMRSALNAFYGDSRRALSLMQRIRGEVLSLTASFVGFYGVFRTGTGILEAFSTLEAAQNRLSAAFGQNATRTAAEINYLQAEADRLGISFATLSDNYSKFVISGQQAGLETEQLRDIFRQVSEAGRVLKLSNDQLNGTFTALTQIAGKGTLQMEELRQQLGDRIPGAVGLVASGLGYASDELAEFYKAVENGQVGAEEALVALGNALEKQYGGQLSEALDTVQSKLGRLQNLLFNRQLTAANSGFIEGLEVAIEALNQFLESDEGIRLFEQIGAAFGQLFELLPGILENFDRIVFAIKALIALKFAQFLRDVRGGLAAMGTTSVATRRQMVLLDQAVRRAIPGYAAASRGSDLYARSLRTLRRVAFATVGVIRGLLAGLGGPLGIAIAALSFFAVDSIGGADEAVDDFNRTLDKHRDILNDVQTAYDRNAEGADRWRKVLEQITELEAETNLRLLEQQRAEQAGNPLTFAAIDFRMAAQEAAGDLPGFEDLDRRIREATQAFQDGFIDAEAFKRVLSEISENFDGLVPPEATRALLDVVDKVGETETAVDQAKEILRATRGEADETTEVVLGLGDGFKESGDQIADAAEKFTVFEEAVRALAEQIPELEQELKRMDAIKEIETSFENALAAARALPDAIMRIAATAEAEAGRLAALDNLAIENLPSGFSSADSGVDAARSLIMQREGFRETPYWDVNALRAGFGSDTITLSDGTIQRVTEGIRVTREDALRDLERRITTEFMPRAREQAGAARFDSFTPQQQAVLTSIAYNYGELPDRIIAAVRTGTDEEIANAIRGLAGDNDGVNAGRRNEEAAIFARGVGADAANDRAADRLEEQRQFRDGLQEEIAQQEFLNSLEGKRLLDAEVAKALREAEAEAKSVGLELTKQEREAIEAITRAKFAAQQADEDRNVKLEEAQRLEEQITLLQERRRFLQQRQDTLEGNGDLVGAANVEAELETIDARLEETINKAMEFWRALGGEGSESALQNLEFAKAELEDIEQQVVTTGRQMNEFFADTATAAIDRFSQRVANGENALQAFAEEFRRMAAEIILQIAQMIIRQAIFNALAGGSAGGQGGVGGAVAGVINGIFHGGGIAGGASQTRMVNPAVMANAIRYHTGGIAGLRPDEVPAILREGEEVLTDSDPRHRFNGGLGGGKPEIKIVNAVDGTDAMEQALSTPGGQEVMVNYMRRNADRINAALGR